MPVITNASGIPAPEQSVWLPIQRFNLSLLESAVWSPLGESGIQARELGLHEASAGAMAGWHLRGPACVDTVPPAVGAQSHFELVYVFKGSAQLRAANGELITLAQGDCVHQPGLSQRYTLELGANAELVQLAVPRRPETAGQAFDLESAAQAREPVLNREGPEAYRKGDGPRKYFLYRDLGVAQATEGRVHIHIIQATDKSAPGGTGWHRHSMCQLFVVFSGWAVLAIEGREDVRMSAGDAMCIAAGTAHNVPSFSEDYSLVEVCIPADYDTVDSPPPIAA